MGITITNAGSHSGGKTYSYIISYVIGRTNSYAEKQIPGAATPTVDTDTTVRHPTKYRIRLRITAAEKSTLNSLATEEDLATTMNDGSGAVNVRPETVEFDARPGYLDYPWTALLVLIGTDH